MQLILMFFYKGQKRKDIYPNRSIDRTSKGTILMDFNPDGQ